jgi:outer membrane protein assembly factor BamB
MLLQFLSLMIISTLAVTPPWQQYLATSERTGFSTFIRGEPCGNQWQLKASNLTLRTTSVVTSILMGSPPVFVDAIAVFTNDGIVSLIINSFTLWKFNTSYSYSTSTAIPSPAFSPSGDVLYVSSGTKLFALSVSSGTQLWVSTEMSSVAQFSIAITPNILVVTGISTIYIFEPKFNGTNYTIFSVNTTITAAPAIELSRDNIFFVAKGIESFLIKINKFGFYINQMALPQSTAVTSSPLISQSANYVYVIQDDGKLLGYDRDTFLNICSIGNGVDTPFFIPGLSISFSSPLNEVIAIPTTYGVAFNQRCFSPILGTYVGYTPATSFASDGRSLVFGTSDGRIISIQTQNPYSLLFVANISSSGAPGPSITSAPAIGSNGTIYVGTADGSLVAFGDLICPKGSYTSIFGCILCPAGSYSSTSSSARSCNLCIPGTFSTTIGATSNATCVNCPKGQFSNSSGSTSCINCPAGSYNTGLTSTSKCTLCTSSCYCPLASQVECPSKMVYPMYAFDELHGGLSTYQGPIGYPIVNKLPFSTGQASRPVSGIVIGPQGGIISSINPLSDLIFIGMNDDVFAVSGVNQVLVNNYDMPAGQMFDGQPLIAPWGIVYIISSTFTLYALPWERGAPPLWSTPTITTSYSKYPSNYSRTPLTLNVALGSVVFAAGGSIYSVNAFNGSVQWTFVMPRDSTSDGQCGVYCPFAIKTTPAISPNGLQVYFGADDSYAYALSAITGAISWTYPARGKVRGSPSVNKDGSLVYFASDENNLIVLNTLDGTAAWLTPFATTAAVRVTPAISTDGVTAILGAIDGTFFSSNTQSEKTITWKIQLDGTINTSATIDSNGIVYVGTSAGSLYSINSSTGFIYWKTNIGEPFQTSPVIDANGAILLPSYLSSAYYSVIGTVPTVSPTPSATSSGSSSSTSSPTTSSTSSGSSSSTSSSTSSAAATKTSSSSATATASPVTSSPSPSRLPPASDNSSASKLTNNDVIAIATAVPSTLVLLGVIFILFQRPRLSPFFSRSIGGEGENVPLRPGSVMESQTTPMSERIPLQIRR